VCVLVCVCVCLYVCLPVYMRLCTNNAMYNANAEAIIGWPASQSAAVPSQASILEAMRTIYGYVGSSTGCPALRPLGASCCTKSMGFSAVSVVHRGGLLTNSTDRTTRQKERQTERLTERQTEQHIERQTE